MQFTLVPRTRRTAKNTKNAVDTLIWMLVQALSKGSVSIDDMRRRGPYSLRTFRRHVARLRAAGVTLEPIQGKTPAVRFRGYAQPENLVVIPLRQEGVR
jgi:hypothetical protein